MLYKKKSSTKPMGYPTIAHVNQPPFPPALVRYCDLKKSIATEVQKGRRMNAFPPLRSVSEKDQVMASIIQYRMGHYQYEKGHKKHNAAIFTLETSYVIAVTNEVYKWYSKRETAAQVGSLINMECLMGRPSVRKYKHNHQTK